MVHVTPRLDRVQTKTDKENWLKFYVNPYSGMAEAELTEPVALNQANLLVRSCSTNPMLKNALQFTASNMNIGECVPASARSSRKGRVSRPCRALCGCARRGGYGSDPSNCSVVSVFVHMT